MQVRFPLKSLRSMEKSQELYTSTMVTVVSVPLHAERGSNVFVIVWPIIIIELLNW